LKRVCQRKRVKTDRGGNSPKKKKGFNNQNRAKMKWEGNDPKRGGGTPGGQGDPKGRRDQKRGTKQRASVPNHLNETCCPPLQ